MIVSIHQPAYLPWMGYFDKIARSDLFVYLDTVQFQKSSFQNRNKIRTAQEPIWLTVPVQTKGKLFDTALKDVEIDNRQDWARKHYRSIEHNYRTAKRFKEVLSLLRPFYEPTWHKLSDICFGMMTEFNAALRISTPIVKSSALKPIDSRKSDLVLDICRQVGATKYLSGSMGRDYLDLESFVTAGIEVEFQNYEHPVYPQNFPGFVSSMAVVDLLMNESEAARFFARQK